MNRLKDLALFRDWKIGPRLWATEATVIGVLVVTVALSLLSSYLAYRNVVRALIIASNVADAVDSGRDAQVHFKKQVQEWKNVLLRGNDRTLYDKYWNQFVREEEQTQERLTRLRNLYEILEINPSRLDQTSTAHLDLGKKYREAIKAYEITDPGSAFRVDVMVRGMDRPATDSMDELIKEIQVNKESTMNGIVSSARERFYTSLAITCVVLLLLLAFVVMAVTLTIRSITTPLQETMPIFDSIGSGNLSTEIPNGRKDEMGQVWKHLGEMQDTLRYQRDRLHEMNRELGETIQEIATLKTQQDGDYFLTSQLIVPLMMNHAQSEFLSVDFFIKQKKDFHFKKWHRDLGGDICSAHMIQLQGRSSLAFLNGDAMGKSMQGAGGALVLGAVFESIVERSKFAAHMFNQSPERWIKNAFVELHKVFESFNGSMMVSLALGIVDEKSGLLYYTSAEHPHPVLYRGGKASFLDESMMFRKLGFVGAQSQLRVMTCQLEPGDVVIFGSDGRDDLVLSTDAEGGRVINEDETQFVLSVEEGKGDLTTIVSHLEARGEFSDDISLLRIGFLESHSVLRPAVTAEGTAALNQYKDAKTPDEYKAVSRSLASLSSEDRNQPDVMRALVRSNIQIGNYGAAGDLGMQYITEYPADGEFFYYTSYCLRKSGNLEQAIELGERVLLRRPDHIQNMMNLARAYMKANRTDRAKKILEMAQKQDPDNSPLLALIRKAWGTAQV